MIGLFTDGVSAVMCQTHGVALEFRMKNNGKTWQKYSFFSVRNILHQKIRVYYT